MLLHISRNHDNMRKKNEDIEKKLENSSSKFAEIQETMTILNKRRHQNKNQIIESENKLEELRKLPEKNQKEIAECEKKVEKLAKQKIEQEEELQRNYKVVEQQTKPLIEEREKLETELMDLKINVDEAKADLALSESELKIVKHDETTEVRKYESMKGAYEESEQTLKEKKLKANELKESIPHIKQDVSEKSQQLLNLQTEEKQLRSQLIIIKGEVKLNKNLNYCFFCT